jgi:hypothetical protein
VSDKFNDYTSNPTALRVVKADVGRGPYPILYPRRSVPHGQSRVPGSDSYHCIAIVSSSLIQKLSISIKFL